MSSKPSRSSGEIIADNLSKAEAGSQGLMLKGVQSGLWTRMAKESGSLCARMRLAMLLFFSVGLA
jgi:hypothetical protein